jgi:hypothetical protein
MRGILLVNRKRSPPVVVQHQRDFLEYPSGVAERGILESSRRDTVGVVWVSKEQRCIIADVRTALAVQGDTVVFPNVDTCYDWLACGVQDLNIP